MARHDQRPTGWMVRCVLCKMLPALRSGVLCAPCRDELKEAVHGN